MNRTLWNTDTLIETREVGPGVVQMRYLKPLESGWITEHYEMTTLKAVGWSPTKEKGGDQ